MSLTTRVLPAEEWPRLVGTELEGVSERLTPTQARVSVVEDESGAIVGCVAASWYLGAEGLWIAPEHRKRAAVARALIRALREVGEAAGVQAAVGGIVEPEVVELVEDFGGIALPGQLFLIPLSVEVGHE